MRLVQKISETKYDENYTDYKGFQKKNFYPNEDGSGNINPLFLGHIVNRKHFTQF